MPVSAARLADVLVGHPNPPVALGLGDHRLDQAAIVLLDLSPAVELGLRLAEPGGERVADPLQLGDPQHPRPPDRANRPVDPLTGEGGGEQLAESLLQQGDLPAETLAGGTLGSISSAASGMRVSVRPESTSRSLYLRDVRDG